VLKHNQVAEQNVEPESGYNSVIVIGPRNLILGCLPFRLKVRPKNRISVLVGQAVPCGTSGGASFVNDRDWPDPSL
jgi:hypothetical protein